MRSYFLVFALIVAVCVSSASSARAQFYPYGGYYPLPNPGIQYLGRLPNGIPVFNPWNLYSNSNYNNGQLPPYYNQQAFNPIPAYYNNLLATYYGYTGINPYAFQSPLANALGVQRQPGRFVAVAPDLAVNPLTGTRLAPYRGIAETNQGTFFRIPGTGSLTAFGTFDPTSGAYLNPLTGAIYNPGSGLIVQR